jgi:hypothetical protein
MTESVSPGVQPPSPPQPGDGAGPRDPNAIPIWHYSQGGTVQAVLGPITHDQMLSLIRGGGISPLVSVWREGMLEWAAIKDVPELVPAINASAVMEVGRAGGIQRNAKTNCITMFVMFCVCAVTFWFPGCGFVAIACGVFAAIYVPIRWRAIKALPNPCRTLGMIGGFGLIVMIVLSIAAMCLWGFYVR